MRRLFVLSLLLLTNLLLTARAHADSPPTLAVYHEQIRAAYAAAQRSDRIGLDDIAATLAATHTVRLDDGTELPVDNSWLTRALAQEPPPFPLITARLGAILDAINQPHTSPSADALPKLQGVFNVPPFRDRAVPSTLTNAWHSFWAAVGRTVQQLFTWLFGGSSNPSPSRPAPALPAATGWTGLSGWGAFWLVLGLLLVLAIVIYAVRGVKGSLVRDAKAHSRAEAEAGLTATQALERAENEVRSGDYRHATRFLYLSSLLWLHEQHLLRYDHALTNREYLQQLEGRPLQAQLAPIVETFDRVWYGRRELGPTEFQAYEALIAQLRAGSEKAA